MVGDLSALVAEAQGYEDDTHTDTCVVTRAGEPTWDPEHGEQPGTPVTILPVDPAKPTFCRVRTPSRLASKDEAGEHQWSLQDSILRLSATEPGIDQVRLGDQVKVTTNVNGIGLTRKFEIVAHVEGSHMSGSRFVIRRAV